MTEKKITLINNDCLLVLKSIDDSTIDAIVTDPPYELGFMGKKWDSTGIANNVELWRECLRVLKPGGHLLSFGGTRTYHRMACSIEDAGFEIRDMIEWVYGSGFPKSLNIGKAVDKFQGNEREVVGKIAQPGSTNTRLAMGNGWQDDPDLTKGTSEWEGYGTALKPAHEPICMARKPLEKGLNVAQNCLKWGTGGIDVDGSRVGTGTGEKKLYIPNDKNNVYGKNMGGGDWDNSQGRFPANLIHDGSEEVTECFPNNTDRFFKSIIYQAKASKSERNMGCECLSDKKGGSYEFRQDGSLDGKIPINKNNHPTVKPVALMEYLINMVSREGQTVLDPFMGSGTTGIAAKKLGRNFIGIELDSEYLKIAEARINETKP